MAILRIPLMETIGKQTMISSCNTMLKTINLFIFIMTEHCTFEKTDEMQGGDIYWKEKLTMLCRLDKLYVKQNSTNLLMRESKQRRAKR